MPYLSLAKALSPILNRPKFSFYLAKLCLIIILILGGANSLKAQTLGDISQDFAPIPAIVVSQKGSTVILDKGRKDGVHGGDLFTIYKRGEKIVHPVTKKVLGYLKTPIAWVEVFKVDEAFCQARIIAQKGAFSPGAPAKRFADIKALMIGNDPATLEEVYLYLSVQLPDIHFVKRKDLHFSDLTVSFLRQQGFLLVFLQEGSFLRIYNRGLEVIKVYDISPLVVSRPQASNTPAAPRLSRPQLAQKYPYTTLETQRPATAVFRKVGHLSEVVIDFEMGDLDGDGRPEIVYLTPEALYVTKYRAQGAWRYAYQGFGKILNFSLGPQGYLALNIFVDKQGFRSQLLHFGPQGLRPVVKDINLLLGFFDTNGDGKKDLFLGQSYDSANFFGTPVYRLAITPNGIQKTGKFTVPHDFRLLGAAVVDLDADGRPEIITQNLGHKLEIYRDRQKIWTSSLKVGGSLYTIQATVKGTDLLPKLAISAEVDPYVIRLAGDKAPLVLVVSNQSSHRNLLPGIPAYSGGQVLALTKTSLGYQLLPFSGSLDAPIQGLGVYQKEVFVAMVKGNPFTQKGESYLLAFPLKRPVIP